PTSNVASAGSSSVANSPGSSTSPRSNFPSCATNATSRFLPGSNATIIVGASVTGARPAGARGKERPAPRYLGVRASFALASDASSVGGVWLRWRVAGARARGWHGGLRWARRRLELLERALVCHARAADGG